MEHRLQDVREDPETYFGPATRQSGQHSFRKYCMIARNAIVRRFPARQEFAGCGGRRPSRAAAPRLCSTSPRPRLGSSFLRWKAPGRSDWRLPLPLPFQGVSHRNFWNARFGCEGTHWAGLGQDLCVGAHGNSERMGPPVRPASVASNGLTLQGAGLRARQADRNCWNTACKTSGKTLCCMAAWPSDNPASNLPGNIA